MVRFFYLRIFSAPSFIALVSPENTTSSNIHISLSRIIMSGLFLGMFRTAFTSSFHNVVTLPSRLVSTNFGTWSYQCSLSNFIPVSFHMLKYSYHKLHNISLCTVHLPILSKLIQCGLLSRNVVDIICIWFLFPFVIFLLPDTWFLMPHIALLSVLAFQISPRQPSKLILFTNKLSKVLSLCITPISLPPPPKDLRSLGFVRTFRLRHVCLSALNNSAPAGRIFVKFV
jgi:hypothetical protein